MIDPDNIDLILKAGGGLPLLKKLWMTRHTKKTKDGRKMFDNDQTH